MQRKSALVLLLSLLLTLLLLLLLLRTLLLVQVNSLDDMRRFILEHSDFSRAQGNVTKHVNIVTQLSDVVGTRHLMDVSTVGATTAVCLW
jgi:Na+/alanine symporter